MQFRSATPVHRDGVYSNRKYKLMVLFHFHCPPRTIYFSGLKLLKDGGYRLAAELCRAPTSAERLRLELHTNKLCSELERLSIHFGREIEEHLLISWSIIDVDGILATLTARLLLLDKLLAGLEIDVDFWLGRCIQIYDFDGLVLRALATLLDLRCFALLRLNAVAALTLAASDFRSGLDRLSDEEALLPVHEAS